MHIESIPSLNSLEVLTTMPCCFGQQLRKLHATLRQNPRTRLRDDFFRVQSASIKTIISPLVPFWYSISKNSDHLKYLKIYCSAFQTTSTGQCIYLENIELLSNVRLHSVSQMLQCHNNLPVWSRVRRHIFVFLT